MTPELNLSRNITFPIYVIGNDASTVEEISDFLKLHDFTVYATSVLTEALRWMRIEAKPFLVVAGKKIRGLNGVDLAGRLRHSGDVAQNFEILPFPTPDDLDQLVPAIYHAAEALNPHRDVKTDDRDIAAQMTEFLGKVQELISAIESTGIPIPCEKATPMSPARPVLTPEESEMLHWIKALQIERQFRDKLLPPSVDDDPKWAILLYLLEQSLLHQVASITSACHATTLPSTTAIRKIDELVSTGWLEKRPDSSDHRRTLVAPTSLCRDRMRSYLLGLPTSMLCADKRGRVGALSTEDVEGMIRSAAGQEVRLP